MHTCEILELDGPPVAAFILPGIDGYVAIRYKIVKFLGSFEECQRAQERFQHAIRADLRDATLRFETSDDFIVADGKKFFPHVQPIIWWRHRPEVEVYDDYCCLYARFDTTPPLLSKFWEKWHCEEGLPPRGVKEVLTT